MISSISTPLSMMSPSFPLRNFRTPSTEPSVTRPAAQMVSRWNSPWPLTRQTASFSLTFSTNGGSVKQFRPHSPTTSFIASIYKKGNPKLQENNRPIALLNAMYKVFASILKQRIKAGVEKEMHNTQFGSRAGRSTSEPMFVIHRLQDFSERHGSEGYMAFLDWSKACDRIPHAKIGSALRRLGQTTPYAAPNLGRCVPNRHVRCINTSSQRLHSSRPRDII